MRTVPTILLHRRNDGDIILQSVGNILTAAIIVGNEGELLCHLSLKCVSTVVALPGIGPKSYTGQKKLSVPIWIKRFVKQSPMVSQFFFTGMARGVDLVAGEIVLQLRTEGFPIRLICASPYPGFERSWSNDWQHRYNAVIKDADIVRYICPRYHRGCFQTRNEWLVNHSARVIAVFNGQPSGTKNTIDYAHQQGVQVIQIEG